jgi:hypothetical protein
MLPSEAVVQPGLLSAEDEAAFAAAKAALAATVRYDPQSLWIFGYASLIWRPEMVGGKAWRP